ncbi:unnamed protein product [Sphenostylis stenocarpa]|uniref:Uncharacterized protein n=1 Tax=Sphenostylis stenocarpa TaxID=92480 RepID=A0AA86VYM3_9FABA|nr:unnamed protein product [Sphenostylis stenocarpa]
MIAVLQLASRKKRLSSRCASFVCFGCASARLDTKSHLRVGHAKHHDVSSGTLVSTKGMHPSDNGNGDSRKVALKSSLKRRENKQPAPVEAVSEHEASVGKGNNAHGQTGRREVQWTDACGSELVQIQEFEPSLEVPESLGALIENGLHFHEIPFLTMFSLFTGFNILKDFSIENCEVSVDEFDNGNNKTCSCAIM